MQIMWRDLKEEAAGAVVEAVCTYVLDFHSQTLPPILHLFCEEALKLSQVSELWHNLSCSDISDFAPESIRLYQQQ